LFQAIPNGVMLCSLMYLMPPVELVRTKWS